MVRILCLHGRGSNNDIFRMQTGGFRSLLDDYEWEFVQGQMPHSEGNWQIHTKDFAQDGLWGYMNLLDPDDVLRTEKELLDLAFEDGPYDGVLGYSQGATLASQALIRFQEENPNATIDEMPFRFVIYFNAATPTRVFKADSMPLEMIENPDLEDEFALNFISMMKSNPLFKNINLKALTSGQNADELMKSVDPSMARSMAKLNPARMSDGRQALVSGDWAMCRMDPKIEGVKLKKLRTLHVRCLGDRLEYGQEMYELCDPELATQYLHDNKHDFPRGSVEMRKIAELIRQTVERSL